MLHQSKDSSLIKWTLFPAGSCRVFVTRVISYWFTVHVKGSRSKAEVYFFRTALTNSALFAPTTVPLIRIRLFVNVTSQLHIHLCQLIFF